MTPSLWLILPVSVVLGTLSGLGTGGGSLLIILLTLGLDMDHNTARTINLMFFLPAALIACYFRRKQQKLDFKKVFPAILSGTVTAAVFCLTANRIELKYLKKLFGLLLLYTGIRELLYRPRKAR
jgi:uncharacterized membrane protein YfcA